MSIYFLLVILLVSYQTKHILRSALPTILQNHCQNGSGIRHALNFQIPASHSNFTCNLGIKNIGYTSEECSTTLTEHVKHKFGVTVNGLLCVH